MNISDKGLALIKKYEGCHLTAYLCPAGYYTIGYGHTAGVEEGMTITQEDADAYLLEDCSRSEREVERYNNEYGWNQNEFDALVSFAYNIGSIHQLTAGGTRSREEIAQKMLEYASGGGKTLPGLVKRRKEEQTLFLGLLQPEGEQQTEQSARGVLREGSEGEEVKGLQTLLVAKGYPVGEIDGNFGTDTKAAVVSFQEASGLMADGIVGKNTWAQLDIM